MNIFQRARTWAIDRRIADQEPNRNAFIANIVEELGEYAEAMKQNDTEETVDAVADIMVFSLTELVKMGYDSEKVMDEVLKVVESRVGKWDEVNNKFQKDLSEEARLNWYTPDYNSCKER
jgi:phosphoribosyl-ATP pyrophosphohydrolase